MFSKECALLPKIIIWMPKNLKGITGCLYGNLGVYLCVLGGTDYNGGIYFVGLKSLYTLQNILCAVTKHKRQW